MSGEEGWFDASDPSATRYLTCRYGQDVVGEGGGHGVQYDILQHIGVEYCQQVAWRLGKACPGMYVLTVIFALGEFFHLAVPYCDVSLLARCLVLEWRPVCDLAAENPKDFPRGMATGIFDVVVFGMHL